MNPLQPISSTAWLSLLLVTFVFQFSIAELRATSTDDFYPELATSNIPDDLKKGANAVVRYADTRVNLLRTDAMAVTESVAITVLNNRGARFLAFYETYKEKSEKLSDISIEFLNEIGMVIKKVKPKEIEEMAAGDDIAIISDRKAKFLGWETDNYPVTIKYSYRKESGNTLFLPPWFPIPADRVAVESSTYKVSNQTHSELEFQEKNLDGYEIEKLESFSYSLGPTKRIIKEKFTPSLYDIFPHVNFKSDIFSYEGISGTFNNWDTYGEWVYHALLKPKQTVASDQLINDLQGRIPKGGNDKETVKNIYEYIQENTRYIFVNLADGGLVPMSSGDVHEKKYGDCKALTFYTQAILDAYDIPSSYVINEAGYEQSSFSPEYCDAYQGNHIILMVPLESDTLWMDCTSGDAPFNFLGAFTDDRVVLAVNEEGGKLVRTPKYGADLNQDLYKNAIQLETDLGVTVDYTLTSHGLSMDQRMYYYKMGEKEQTDQLRKEFDDLLNLKLSNLSHKIDKDNLMGSEKYTISADDYCEKAGDYILIPQRFESIYIPKIGKKKSRKYPVLFERGGKESHHDTYTIPEGYLLKTIPESVEIKGDYGVYSKKITSISDTQFVIERSFELFEGEYPADEYQKIKSFFNKIKKEESSKMTLSKIIRP